MTAINHFKLFFPYQQTKRVRIKRGSGIFQDHGFGRWPTCAPPASEYEGEEYKHEAKDPDMEFIGRWCSSGEFWDCKADGYGHMKSSGDPGEYGNGSISVSKFDSVEILGDVE